MKCDNPTFGIWGGPPKGEKRSQPKAATNLAFVKRGQVKLASLLFDDVPELEITAGAQRVRRPTPVVKDKPADKSADPDDGEAAAEESGCGCTVTGASSSWGLAWLVVGAALLARRRRRWALCKPSLRGRTAR